VDNPAQAGFPLAKLLVGIVLIGAGLVYADSRGWWNLPGLAGRFSDGVSGVQHSAGATPGTVERAESEVRRALGVGNRNVDRIAALQFKEGGIVSVRFALNSHVSESAIREGARSDVVAVLKALDDSGYAFTRVDMIGTFPVAAPHGRAEEVEVLRATFMREAVSDVDWSGLQNEAVLDLADSAWRHPALR
jgi:hypothetical protein